MSVYSAFAHSIADPNWRQNNLYKIKSKEKESIQFHRNPLQLEILSIIKILRKENKPIRIIILKPRQIGCTTFFCIEELDICHFSKNQFAAIIAHKVAKANEIFDEIIKFSFDNLPEQIRQKANYDSVRELAWRSIASKIKVTTDGQGITPSFLHCTEVAYMRDPKKVIGGALQGLPLNFPGILESTANGVGNYFHDVWLAATQDYESAWTPIFLKWWKHPDYRMTVPAGFEMDEEEKEILIRYAADGLTIENLVWRRFKIKEAVEKVDDYSGLSGKLLFKQDYPMTPEEAFIVRSGSSFNVEVLEEQLKDAKTPMGNERYILGEPRQIGRGQLKVYKEREDGCVYLVSCDPSHGDGNDPSATYVIKKSTREIVAVLHGYYLPGDLAKRIVNLAVFYNNALLVVERNSGGAVLLEIQKHIGYNNLYYHVDEEAHTKAVKAGFPTSSKTRSQFLGKMEDTVDNKEVLLYDVELIKECLAFGWKDGKKQAMFGHDDRVIAYAIGNLLCMESNYRLFQGQKISKPAGL